jgi:putative ABC transport system ATP-binding protein
MGDRQASLRGLSLTRTFGHGTAQTTALRDVSVELQAGQVGLLVGPSGSGKSTLLAVLSGLLRPDRGEVLTQGVGLWQLSDRVRKEFRRRHFGFIFQGCNLFPALTARQQLEMVLRWGAGASRRQARQGTADLLERLGLTRQADLCPHQLSGGEKQRVAIGRALMKNPALCFADEPTSALDWTHGRQVVELLQAAAHERGATVIMVSHDVRLVPYADRIFHLVDGCLMEPRFVGQVANLPPQHATNPQE